MIRDYKHMAERHEKRTAKRAYWERILKFLKKLHLHSYDVVEGHYDTLGFPLSNRPTKRVCKVCGLKQTLVVIYLGSNPHEYYTFWETDK